MRLPRIALSALIASLPLAAQADILKITFTDQYGSQKVLEKNDTWLVNTGENLELAMSAGLDRRVKASVLDAEGAVVSQASSDLIGATNRITVDGEEYYGARISLSVPGEGEYTLVDEIVDSSGQSVKKISRDLTVDLTGPTLSDIRVKGEWNRTMPDGTLLRGPNRFTGIEVKSADALTEVAGIEVYSIDSDGNQTSPVAAIYSDGIAQTKDWGHLFPNGEDKYELIFRATDIAGNTNELSQPIAWDSVGGKSGQNPVPVAIYDPEHPTATPYRVDGKVLDGYVEYESGMSVYSDAYHALFRIAKTNSYESNIYGLKVGGWCSSRNCIQENVVAADADHFYKRSQTDIFERTGLKSKGFNIYDWVMNGAGNFYVQVQPAGAVKIAPDVTKVRYLRSDGNWVAGDNLISLSAPNQYDRIQITVQERPYEQEVFGSYFSKVAIPAGQTVVEQSIDLSFSGRGCTWPGYYAQPTGNETLRSTRYGMSFCWDQNKPEVVSVTKSSSRGYKVHFRETDSFDGWGLNRWVISSSSALYAVSSSGEEVPMDVVTTDRNTAHDWYYTFDASNLPEGQYDSVKAVAYDRFGNRKEETFSGDAFSLLIDKSAPTIEIANTGEDLVSDLDQFEITVSDADDPAPAIKSIKLVGGPANENVQLSWRGDPTTGASLEYPIMFPSMVAGEEYSLEVVAIDDQENESTETFSFMFEPATTVVNGEKGVLIPAIQESIVGGGLPPVYSEPIHIAGDTLVVGEYDLVATLRSDSDFSVNILGYEIRPGETVIIDNFDFSLTDSRIVLPLYPTENIVGEASLLVFPEAPGAEYVLANIKTWMPNPVVTVNEQPFGDGLKIQQALEPINISVTGGPGDPCTYTSNEEEILGSNPLFDPMCTVEWDLPDTVQWDDQEYTASGYLAGLEEDADIGYQIFLPQGGNIKGTQVSADSTTIDIVEPDIAWAFDPDEAVTRYITEFSKSIINTGSIECSPTVNPADARVGTKYGYPKCLVEWNLVPDGIATSRYTPIVQGVAQEKDQLDFTFDVTYFDPDQNPYIMAEQSLSIPVDPPKPIELTMPSSEYEPDANDNPKYFVGIDGDYIGTGMLTGSGADIDLALSVGGRMVRDWPYLHRGGRDRDAEHEFRIWIEDLTLWEANSAEISAAYQLMPEINDAEQATVIGVPSSQMRAKMDVEGRKLLDTDEIEVKVNLDGRAVSDGYNPAVHGEWEVQIQYEENEDSIRKLTDWRTLGADGSVTETLKLGAIENGYMYGVLRLKSPYEEYSREMKTNRNFINILRGGEIDGEITASRVTGRSVFTAFLRVQVDDQSYDNSLGEVEWLISEDEGATWSPVEDGARGNYMKGDFNAGRYWIKARLHNKYTDAVSETGVQQIHVYDVPRVDIEGAQYAFTTQEVELRATATLDWEPVPIENYHVEWSADGGESWEPGLTTTAKYDGETDRVRYRVRVRDMDAPMDEEGIWRERSHRLNFIEPEGPRTRIYGPRRLERGDPGDYTVEMNPPRRNMDIEMEGEWVLPDGTVIPGSDPITYNPSEDDVSNGRVELIYRSWAVGYRDQGAIDERVHRISAWQYVWPEWDVFANTRAMEAPAELRLTPRTPGWFGWLDNEQYDWTFPAGATQVYDNDKRPTIRIEEPGEHEIRLRVFDERGNETEIVKSVTLEEPEATNIDFSYYTDNEFMRAPLEIRPRIYMRGGHRLDRVKEREILINGESFARDTRIRSFILEEPGSYEITAKLYSTMGREVAVTETIEVVPNKPPICDPKTDDRFGYLIVEANCSDEDGDIDEIRWEMAGEVLPSSSYKYRFTEDQLAENNGRIQLQVSAKDDAGVYSVRETVNYVAP